jgi:hypothetical protein
MPALDRQGPLGEGPMTGGQRGVWGQAGSGYNAPVYGGMRFGRGSGMWRGPRTGC